MTKNVALTLVDNDVPGAMFEMDSLTYPLDELKKKLQRIGILHQAAHFDCCNAGGIFMDGRSGGAEYRVLTMATHPVVTAITAVVVGITTAGRINV